MRASAVNVTATVFVYGDASSKVGDLSSFKGRRSAEGHSLCNKNLYIVAV